ncbi:MAG: flagellar basal body protein FliL [Methylophaga sp.]|nr:MAG: flagellar basal body protein FliL [Methylophaga sp.]
MAEEAEQKDDIEVTEGGGGKSKLLIIIIAVVVLALAGVGAMMFLGGDEEMVEGENSDETVEIVKSPPIYHTVESPFIVNFSEQSNGTARYLQIKLKVMAREQAAIDAFMLHEPAIQHDLLMLFYGQNYDALNTTEGTRALREATLTSINTLLKVEKVTEQIEAVYFTSLIMQ